MTEQFRRIDYTGKAADAIHLPMRIYNDREWIITFLSINAIVFETTAAKFTAETGKLRDGIWLHERRINFARADLCKIDADTYEFSKKKAGKAYCTKRISRELIEGAVRAISSLYVYYRDREDPVYFFFEERPMKVNKVLLGCLCVLIQRRILCHTLPYCTKCQAGHLYGERRCTCYRAVKEHEACNAHVRPTLERVKKAHEEMIPHYWGLGDMLRTIIEENNVDVAVNYQEWLTDAKFTSAFIHRTVINVADHGPTPEYSLARKTINAIDAEKLCQCHGH